MIVQPHQSPIPIEDAGVNKTALPRGNLLSPHRTLAWSLCDIQGFYQANDDAIMSYFHRRWESVRAMRKPRSMSQNEQSSKDRSLETYERNPGIRNRRGCLFVHRRGLRPWRHSAFSSRQ